MAMRGEIKQLSDEVIVKHARGGRPGEQSSQSAARAEGHGLGSDNDDDRCEVASTATPLTRRGPHGACHSRREAQWLFFEYT